MTESMERYYGELTDGELLALKVETFKRLSNLTIQLALIDRERALRAPFNDEAEIIPLGGPDAA